MRSKAGRTGWSEGKGNGVKGERVQRMDRKREKDERKGRKRVKWRGRRIGWQERGIERRPIDDHELHLYLYLSKIPICLSIRATIITVHK